MKRTKINYTNCYCLIITIAFVVLSQALMIITTNLSNRIDELEKQNEVEYRDYQSNYIQLHY